MADVNQCIVGQILLLNLQDQETCIAELSDSSAEQLRLPQHPLHQSVP